MKTSRPLYKLRSGEQTKINRSTGRKIHEFYEKHSMIKLSGRYPDVVKADAKASKWVPPLGWDDIDRDDHPVI